ncbi:hypothetical protein JCGZ_13533 [Jatropha curcas]|uniref:Leucine-rich repeat-containing N-terminal plant-type domain-containing protein n=1 Tax=Jatropha curcas TaxID=180498 RepID=A0A067KA79_JATCU|nr:hypothetical protein JCGZ_13533 [Jatropha curcas]
MVDPIFLHIFLFLLLASTFPTTLCTETDISCLKSIKASLEDPNGYLSSWNFNNDTEGNICKFVEISCWLVYENWVLNIELRGMGLKGQFPNGIEKCTSLTGLDLSNNNLQGTIPSDISKKVHFVTSLDLSSNNFSGQIPEGIGRLSRLRTFNVSNNMLSGPVPNFFHAKFSADHYASNKGLCGGPLKRCRNSSKKFRFNYSFKDGFAIGYVVSLISAMVVYASYCIPWVNMGKKDGMITIPAMVMMMIVNNSCIVSQYQL